jgi:hypothetical protein
MAAASAMIPPAASTVSTMPVERRCRASLTAPPLVPPLWAVAGGPVDPAAKADSHSGDPEMGEEVGDPTPRMRPIRAAETPAAAVPNGASAEANAATVG